MYNEKILFLGIGGVSTSLLALYAKRCGATVIGYDAKESDTTRRLEKEGIKIYYKPRPCFTDYDYAVYSSAIKDDNPEIIKTKSLGKPCIERRDFLGFVASLHRRVVAVSGAHGKTTTTALISHILIEAGFDVTSHIGGESLGKTGMGDDIFVAEACEYRGSFLSLQPDVALILNMERDHPDCYPTDESYRFAFEEFAKGIKKGGKLIIPKSEFMKFKGVDVDTVFIGNNKKLSFSENGNLEFNYKGVAVSSPLKGKHNAENIAFAIETAKLFGIDNSTISDAISTFRGVKRRFEKLGTLNNAVVISDYAHHPTELKNTIEVAKTYGKVFALFQPHTYSRTASFFDDFVRALKTCDTAIYKTFSAREVPSDGADAKTLAGKVGSLYIGDDDGLLKFFKEFNAEGGYDVLLILGAGDLDEKVRRYFQS